MTFSKRIYFVLFVLFVLVSFSILESQVRGLARINGKVLDESENPIPDATVLVKSIEVAGKRAEKFEKTTTTNDEGAWKMTGMSSGYVKIDVSAPGFMPTSKNVEVSQLNVNPQIILHLKKAEEFIGQNEDSSGIFEEGNVLFEQGKYDEAITSYQDFLEKNPTAYQVRFNIGNCYREKNELDAAQQEFEAVLEEANAAEGPEALKIQAKAFAAIGELYVKRDDIEKAREYFTQSLERNPQDEILAYNVGEILFSNAKMDEALEYFNMAATIKPGWADAFLKLGYVYLNKTEYDQAKENFNKFLELDP
ncbi:MAG: tetratricopeptide repeat protein, partial [Candidatus Aminicenantaceae bacterium]